MLNRRLIILFVFFTLLLLALSARLAQLQLTQAEQWQREARSFVHRHKLIDTARGNILDVKGRIVAQDAHCWDLAIDYRAMNLDDRWITRAARLRLREQGLTTRKEILPKLAETKARIVEEINSIPAAIAHQMNIAPEDVDTRYNEIRARIRALKQDRWSILYDKNRDEEDGITLTDADLNEELKDETIAHTIIPNIPEKDMQFFRRQADRFPGLLVLPSQRRDYPFKDVACHIIGAMRPIDEETYAREKLANNLFDIPNLLTQNDPGNLRGYLPGDRVGESGVERLAEKALRGTRGAKLLELGATSPEKIIEPAQGPSVSLTLDLQLQADLQKELLNPNRALLRGQDGKDHHVAIVVLDIQGNALLLLSLPTYDLNDYDILRRQLVKDTTDFPLVNRAIASAYPPGSTLKPLVAAAALSENLANVRDTITCNGHLFPNRRDAFRCSIFVEHRGTHGPMHLNEALEVSCNIYFYTLGQRLGLERFFNWFDAFSIGRTTGLELFESKGIIPKRSDLDDPTSANAESIFLGIGQGKVAVTPLQMANAYATVLRGGVEITPRLLTSTQQTTTRRANLSPELVASITDGLDRVVHGSRGTARKVFADLKLPVAGKTGSATTGRMIRNAEGQLVAGDSDSWFVGYAPAQNPKYIIAAVMEFGGHGGSTAAPMVKETILQMQKHGYLPKMD